MDKNFLTKLLAAVLFVLVFAVVFYSGSWTLALEVAVAAFVVDWLIGAMKGGEGWLLFVYGVAAFAAHQWLGFDWLWACGGFAYYVLWAFLVKSGLGDWVFGLIGVS